MNARSYVYAIVNSHDMELAVYCVSESLGGETRGCFLKGGLYVT